MTATQPKPNPLRAPTTAMIPNEMPAVRNQKTKRRIQPAVGPAHSRPMNGRSTRVMGLMPRDRVTSTTPATPHAAECAADWGRSGCPARRAHHVPARARPTMRASLWPEATKLMVKSGLAALTHCAHAPLTRRRRASRGTKTMMSTTPATATRRNRKMARSGFMSPDTATTACSIHRKIGP